MASHGDEPSDDSSSHLSQALETENAWGRSRFTEAEIKTAFELRDHELRRAEEEAAALQAANADGKKGVKPADVKRGEAKKNDVTRKEETKSKRKVFHTKKKDAGELKSDDAELDDGTSMDTSEMDSWNALLTYNFTQDAQDLASLLAEQKRAESFEEFALATPSVAAPSKQASHPVFESMKYQVRTNRLKLQRE